MSAAAKKSTKKTAKKAAKKPAKKAAKKPAKKAVKKNDAKKSPPVDEEATPPSMLGFILGKGDAPTQAFIKISAIHVGENVRTGDWKKRVDELAELLKRGQLQAILVRKYPQPVAGKEYELYCGARRVEAMRKNKEEFILANVTTREYTAAELLSVKLMENMGREQLNPVDEAFAYKQLVDSGMKVKDIAAQFKVTPGLISQRLSIVELEKESQKALKKGEISTTHARALNRVKDPKKQVALLEKTKKKGLEAQQLNEEVDAVLGEDSKTRTKPNKGKAPKTKLVAIRKPDEVSKMLQRYDKQLTKVTAKEEPAKKVLGEAAAEVQSAASDTAQLAYLRGLLIGISWAFDKNSKLK